MSGKVLPSGQASLPLCKTFPIAWGAFDYCARLQRVLAYVMANPDAGLSLISAASIAAMNRTHFSEYFQSHVGVSFKNWIDFVRIHRVMQVLECSDESITRIALDCGFADTTTFTRTFKRITGMTPIRYRRRCRETALWSWRQNPN